MANAQNIHELLYEYLIALKIDPAEYKKYSGVSLGTDIFTIPNQGVLHYVTYFLFNKLDHAKCTKEFGHLWPVLTRKLAADFNKVAYNWLCVLSQENPDARIPKLTLSMFISPNNRKLCSLFLAFARFIVTKRLNKQSSACLLSHPNPTSFTKSAIVNVHFAALQNLGLQHLQVQMASKNLQQTFTKAFSVLKDNNIQIKQNINDTTAAYQQVINDIIQEMNSNDETEARREIEEKNNVLLSTVQCFWNQVEHVHDDVHISKQVLESDFKSMDKVQIDGDDFPLNMPPSLIRSIRAELERENLFRVQENGKTDFPKLIKFFNITLSSFAKPLQDVAAVLDIAKIVNQRQKLQKETDMFCQTFEHNEMPRPLSLEESTNSKNAEDTNWDPQPVAINGTSYYLQRATPTFNKSRPPKNAMNDSASALLMNMSQSNLFESGDSPDSIFSPLISEPHRVRSTRFKNSTKKNVLAKNGGPLFTFRDGDSTVCPTHILNSVAETTKSIGPTVGPLNTKGLKDLIIQDKEDVQTPTGRKSFDFKYEDVFSPPAMNRSKWLDSTDFLLENETMPDCGNFDLTTELNASNILYEFGD